MILVLCISVIAHARQDRAEDRVQVRGVFGTAGFIESDPHDIFGAMVDFRLVNGLRVGPEVLYHIGPGQDRDITSTILLSYDFRRLKRVTPFITGGVGVLHHTNGRSTWNGVTAGFGGGVKIAISRNLYVAPEIRGGWEPIGRAMVSIGYRF
jgi:opacity protein-like surface antigen